MDRQEEEDTVTVSDDSLSYDEEQLEKDQKTQLKQKKRGRTRYDTEYDRGKVKKARNHQAMRITKDSEKNTQLFQD